MMKMKNVFGKYMRTLEQMYSYTTFQKGKAHVEGYYSP